MCLLSQKTSFFLISDPFAEVTMPKNTSIKHIKKPHAILTDIEGTTSSSSFFTEILFPYSRSRLSSYCIAHPDETAAIISEVKAIEPNK